MDVEVEKTAQQLERSAREAGLFVSGDLRVSEADAANLIGLNCQYFKQMRAEGKGPIAYRCGLNGARFSYRLLDLASWIEGRREPS